MDELIRYGRQQLAVGGAKLRAAVPSVLEPQASDLLPGEVLVASVRKE
jgi:hypothetical protein